jgi:hypothetical protein
LSRSGLFTRSEITETFADRQSLAKAAIDDVENLQAALNALWLQLARKKGRRAGAKKFLLAESVSFGECGLTGGR